ncbi:S-adenosylmethionine-dependent methyltransferase (macronuclear) [Tetrahymena thermophila SB210]|uniref:S-adenosylmethionine-dependent methyltransferase n=1 Tax=Tetrahymena thermophila (strain SB210) TaxID=312017 RepID=I7M0P5_TETTS|nr:S-adenosylmethionine-dependent methyltransferase [Tetrahymena thermophila SB210]EAR89985.1 S-adenosylmethionine-dependent methyltransferase [Tetrahymena thermophila SB210]|eukprot:XP_001010230.1 S-adenosylmethionine-dependent methyltransferase [Tetrahymena thermophila SB210]
MENKDLAEQNEVAQEQKTSVVGSVVSESNVDTDTSIDTMPKDNTTYKLKEYWDFRFTKEQKYEWLASYQDIKDVLSQHVKKSDKILLVGCGNSQLGPEMTQDGYENVISSDFSVTVIKNMSEKFPEQKWVVSDVKNLKEFQDGEFDVVFDKATMDALVTDEGSCWNPNQKTVDDCSEMCQAVHRVLKKEGKFLQLTFQDPYFRKRYILNPEIDWKQTNYHKIDTGLGYHFFVIQKN